MSESNRRPRDALRTAHGQPGSAELSGLFLLEKAPMFELSRSTVTT